MGSVRFALLAGVLLFFALPVRAEGLPRVVSMNACTDALLLALAAPKQIVAVSRHQATPFLQARTENAEGYPRIRGTAEEILTLAPDLVLASPYRNRETLARLRAEGIAVHAVSAPATLAEAIAQVDDLGHLLHRQQAAEALNAPLRAAQAQLERQGNAPETPHALFVQQRGYLVGQNALLSSLMTLAGLHNAAPEGRYGRTTLEQLLADPPDVLVLDTPPAELRSGQADTQGALWLMHPALARAVPPDRWLYMPPETALCPVPVFSSVLATLKQQVASLP